MNEPITSDPPLSSSQLFALPLLDTSPIFTDAPSHAALIPSFEIDTPACESVTLEDPRIIELREENQKLRQLAQYLQTYNGSLKKLIELDYSRPSAKRDLLEKLVKEYGLSRRHVCRLLNLARSTCWYRSTAKSGDLQIENSQEMLEVAQ